MPLAFLKLASLAFLLAALMILAVLKKGLGLKSRHYDNLTKLLIAAYFFLFVFILFDFGGEETVSQIAESLGILFLLLFSVYQFYIEGIKRRGD